MPVQIVKLLDAITIIGPSGSTGATGAIGPSGATGGVYEGTFTNSSLSSGTLTINHSLGSLYVLVGIYDNNNNLIVPDEVTLINTASTNVLLNSFGAIAGTWSVIVNSAGGSSSMVYPAFGIPFSNGLSWASSVTAPTGTIVGTSDSQTLTNKTLTSPSISSIANLNTIGIVTASDTLGTLTIAASNAVGGMTLVSSAILTTVSSITFTGLSSGVTYFITMNLLQNTSTGDLSFTSSGDVGGNYNIINSYAYNNISAGGTGLNQNNSQLDGGQGVSASTVAFYNYYFGTIQGSTAQLRMQGRSGYYQTAFGNFYTSMSNDIYYAGTTTFTSVKFTVSAGTVTGTANLYKLN